MLHWLKYRSLQRGSERLNTLREREDISEREKEGEGAPEDQICFLFIVLCNTLGDLFECGYSYFWTPSKTKWLKGLKGCSFNT